VPASAQGKNGSAREAVDVARGITDREFTLDAKGAVVQDGNFGCHFFDAIKVMPVADSPTPVVR
jgi:hypothetical protein